MRLQITQEDINGGIQCNAIECAVAVAYTRVTGHKCQVGSGNLWDLKAHVMADLDNTGTQFVRMFDWNKYLCQPTCVGLSFCPGEEPVEAVKLESIITRKNIPINNEVRGTVGCV